MHAAGHICIGSEAHRSGHTGISVLHSRNKHLRWVLIDAQGKDPKGKGKGKQYDGKGKSTPADPNDFCRWAQTKWNGGYRCTDRCCQKRHDEIRSEAFFEKAPVPKFAKERGLDQREPSTRRDAANPNSPQDVPKKPVLECSLQEMVRLRLHEM